MSRESVELNEIIGLLRKIKKSEDLRWLSRYIAIKAGLKPDLRGIGFMSYRRSAALNKILNLVEGIDDNVQLMTLHNLVGLLWDALRPKPLKGRGSVDVKTVKRDYPVIDWDRGGLLTDDDGNVVMATYFYDYVYIRLWAGKGDVDRKRRKLLSLYADAGMGKGGTGGYVAAALAKGLITEREILAAYHKDLVSADPDCVIYDDFIDHCVLLLRDDHSDQEDE